MRSAIAFCLVTAFLSGVGMAQPPPEPAEAKIELGNAGVDGETAEQTWNGAPISLSLKDAEITEVLRTFAREFELNMVIQPGVAGPITVELNQVPWDQAFDAILRVNGLIGERDEEILKIRPVAQGEKPGLRR